MARVPPRNLIRRERGRAADVTLKEDVKLGIWCFLLFGWVDVLADWWENG